MKVTSSRTCSYSGLWTEYTLVIMKQMLMLKILSLQSRYKRGIGTLGDIDWGLYHTLHGWPFLMRGSWKRQGRMKPEVSKSHSRCIEWGSWYRTSANLSLRTRKLHGLHRSKVDWRGKLSLCLPFLPSEHLVVKLNIQLHGFEGLVLLLYIGKYLENYSYYTCSEIFMI